MLLIYGAFTVAYGQHLNEGMRVYDEQLRANKGSNTVGEVNEWGCRDVHALRDFARKHGYELVCVYEIPGNSLLLQLAHVARGG